jgi:hypothetical protein
MGDCIKIKTGFSNLDVNKKKSFLALTISIIDHQKQPQNKIILNIPQGQSVNIKPDDPDDPYYPDIIYDLYQHNELFLEIFKFITKTTQIKKLNSTLNKYCKEEQEKVHFTRFINIIVIVNLIKKIIKNKSAQSIINILNDIHLNIIPSLNDINRDIIPSLNLHESFNYNYHKININSLININEDAKIYDIFSLYGSCI